ncbi:hypothetical protein BDY21DRAFT_344070 [Lineolata rhizophorae]|uniref:DUF7704 domain-containing protein n=1 Tax=Lineolata rhizophorae TaxID=578093 RepID=A0A6A6P0U5_9PEZI|nr:hypothetical protein BDY21DRAFT_344070 [Lineolata rhizophorae]
MWEPLTTGSRGGASECYERERKKDVRASVKSGKEKGVRASVKSGRRAAIICPALALSGRTLFSAGAEQHKATNECSLNLTKFPTRPNCPYSPAPPLPTMASELPTVPRVVFTILEPASLIAGFLAPLVAPAYFVDAQLPRTPLLAPPGHVPHALLPVEHLLALQLANLYLLLCLLGLLVLHTTREPAVVKAYLCALWLGDVGHVAVSAWAVGWQGLRAWRAWTAAIWGNVGVTVLLWLLRTAYLAGLFGGEKEEEEKKKKKRS